MTVLDHVIRMVVPGLGIGMRWLKEELEAHGVKVRLSEGCLEELVNDAQACASRLMSASSSENPAYLTYLRGCIAERAEFIRCWTMSDEKVGDDETRNRLVRIARQYALPRPWKLSESVAYEPRRPPQGWRWNSGSAQRSCGTF